MSKLPAYVKYPLVIGIVCIACGGALGVVNYVTGPVIKENIIKKENAALVNLAEANNLTYSDLADATYDEGVEHPYVNKRQKFSSSEKNYLYYNATSAKGFSGTVTFGALVNQEAEVIGYTFISGDEDGIGLSAAKKINFSTSKPYTGGSITNDFLTSSASAIKTFPAIQTTLEAIINDATVYFGGSVDSELIANLNKILKAQELTTVTDEDVTSDTLPADGTYAKFTKKLSGFTVNYGGADKATIYYETTCLTSAQYTTEDGDKENYGVCALVTEDGIIGASDNKSETMSIGDYCAQFSVNKPYKVASDIDAIAGSTHSITMVSRLFGDILADFGGK